MVIWSETCLYVCSLQTLILPKMPVESTEVLGGFYPHLLKPPSLSEGGAPTLRAIWEDACPRGSLHHAGAQLCWNPGCSDPGGCFRREMVQHW